MASFVSKSGKSRNGRGSLDSDSSLDQEEPNDVWEDPDLLNNPDLLYEAYDKIPLSELDPNVIRRKGKFREHGLALMKELMIEDNAILEELSQGEPFKGTMEDTSRLFHNVSAYVKRDRRKIKKMMAKHDDEDVWTDEDFEEIGTQENLDEITEWKEAIKEFLDSYKNLRQFMNKSTFENVEDKEEEKKFGTGVLALPRFLRRLQKLLISVKCANMDDPDEEDEKGKEEEEEEEDEGVSDCIPEHDELIKAWKANRPLGGVGNNFLNASSESEDDRGKDDGVKKKDEDVSEEDDDDDVSVVFDPYPYNQRPQDEDDDDDDDDEDNEQSQVEGEKKE